MHARTIPPSVSYGEDRYRRLARGAESSIPRPILTCRRHHREGLTLVDHRFGLVQAPGEETEEAGLEGSPEEQAAAMGSRAFWVQFLRQVHNLLVEKRALGSEDILSGLDRDLVRATRAFQEITPGLLRKKLRQRIGDRGMPPSSSSGTNGPGEKPASSSAKALAQRALTGRKGPGTKTPRRRQARSGGSL